MLTAFNAPPKTVSDQNIAALPPVQKLEKAIQKSTAHMKPEAAAQVQALLTPESLAIMAGMGAAWLVSQAFGVGEIVDLLLIIGGGLTIGWSVFSLAEELYSFFERALTAKTEPDLDAAGNHFAKAVAIGGVTLILSLITRGATRSLRNRVPRIAGPPPQTNKLFYKTSATTDPSLPRGIGATDPYGNVTYSPHGSLQDQNLARYHESVHQFLSPRFRLLQELRADLGFICIGGRCCCGTLKKLPLKHMPRFGLMECPA